VTALSQLRALVHLRWRLVRSRAARLGLLALLALVPLLAALLVLTGDQVEPAALAAAVHAAPAAFLGFGALAIIAPLTSSTATELFPAESLVAYPVRPGTHFLSSLVLAPLNLVWVVQLLVVVAETAFLSVGRPFVGQALASALCFVVAVTAVGQAVAWAAAGLRSSRRGRWVLRTVIAVSAAAAAVIVRTGHGDNVIDHSLAPQVVRVVQQGAAGHLAGWLGGTLALLAVAVTALGVGSRGCRWALSRPPERASGRPPRARSRRSGLSDYRTLLATDRASVWRAPALRRGALVLAVLPGLAAAGVGLPWRSLVFLPGLVAAGGGLLFGFNAFCLDASGAVWLASLPHSPALIARSKARVTAEAVLLGAALAAVLGSVRAEGSPTTTELVAIASSATTCALLVVAACVSSAMRRPYRADLNGPRDAVAPPGAMVMASLRLALPAGLVGGLLEATAEAPAWWAPLGVALPVALVSVLWLARSLRRYDDPLQRSRIVQVVSAG
jgi:hypothetical protein